MRPINYTSIDSCIESRLYSRHTDEIKMWARTVLKNVLYKNSVQVPLRITKYLRVKKRGIRLVATKPLNIAQVWSISPTEVYLADCGWVKVDTDIQRHMLAKDSVVTWAKNILPSYFDVLDWLASGPKDAPKDLTRLSFTQALDKSEKWHERTGQQQRRDRIKNSSASR